MTFIATRRTRHFYLPAILVFLAFSVSIMLKPLFVGGTEIVLAMAGIATFATTIPVLASLLTLYREDRA